jgi:hypothetical protein
MSSQKMNELPLLSVNKTVVFYSPIEGRDVLVRTGTIQEKNSLVHSILHAYSSDYVQLEKNKRIKIAKKFYEKLHDKIVENKWTAESNKLLLQDSYREKIYDLLNNFYKFVLNEDCKQTKTSKKIIGELIQNDKDAEIYAVLCELVQIENVFSEFFKRNDKLDKDSLIEQIKLYTEKMFDNLGKDFDKQKVLGIEKMNELCSTILEKVQSTEYEKFLKDTKGTFPVDNQYLEALSEKVNRDLYFINSKSRMPYRVGSIKGRKSIVLMYHGGNHYEVVGKLLEGNRIQRQFNNDDNLIKRINAFLFKPEVVKELYPNLEPYLKNTSVQESRSESRSESKSSSESDSDSHSCSESESKSTSKSIQSDSASESSKRKSKKYRRSKRRARNSS